MFLSDFNTFKPESHAFQHAKQFLTDECNKVFCHNR